MLTNYELAVSNIRTELKNYIQNSNLQSLVLGISGGIDSALCAALAKPICDELNIPIIGRSITISTNKPDEISRAKNIGEAYLSDFKDVNLTSTYDMMQLSVVENVKTENKDEKSFKIRMGNIKARIRMIYLYELASKHRGMVLSTDNYTEFLLGFWTLHGDVGDYGMIQNLWKTEVYEMSRFLAKNNPDKKQSQALLDCVTATPTDGLGITNSDLDQIQAESYEQVDQILIDFIQNKNKKFENHPVIQRNKASNFKRINPYNIPRNKII